MFPHLIGEKLLIYLRPIKSPIGFHIALINVEATLKQRGCNVVSTLCNVVSTLFEHRALALYQRCKG